MRLFNRCCSLCSISLSFVFKILLIIVFLTFLALSLFLQVPPRITFPVTKAVICSKFKSQHHSLQERIALADTINPQYIPNCSCFRNYFYSCTSLTAENVTNQLYSHEADLVHSTCSDPGTFFEPNQKVISVSLYFKNRTNYFWLDSRFQSGLRENVRLMQKYYPGYTFRVYTDVTLTRNDPYCKLLCENPDLFWCDIRNSPALGNQQTSYFRMWRFLPLGDESVDHFLSRDLDTFITAREVGAVQDWLRHSQKAIHVMRDYKDNHNLPMLAGMWGASNTRLGMKQAKTLRSEIFENRIENQLYPTYHDQGELASKIFFPVRRKVLAHDSYHCAEWKKWTLLRPFPSQRTSEPGAFVGNYIYMNLSLAKCPIACRPAYGKNWEYC